jgi:hypothetical protein
MSNALQQIVRRALLLEGVAALSPAAAAAGQKMAMLLYMARLLPTMYRDRVDAQKVISFGTGATVPRPINGMSPEAEKSYLLLRNDFGDPVKDNIGSLKRLSKAFIKVNAGTYSSKTGGFVERKKWHARAMDMSSAHVDRSAFPDKVVEALFRVGAATSPDAASRNMKTSAIMRTRAADRLLTHSSLTDFYTACLDVLNENSKNPRAVGLLESVISLILRLADQMTASFEADQGSDDRVEDQLFTERISESIYDDIFDIEEPNVSIDTVSAADKDVSEEADSAVDEAQEALQLLEKEFKEMRMMRMISYEEEINDLISDIREAFTDVEDLLSGAAGGV